MSDDDDDGFDAEDWALIGLMARAARAEVARSLLAGNDTGCFSTEQYRVAYERKNLAHLFEPDKLPLLWSALGPDGHLRSIPGEVREVSPGVWASAKDVVADPSGGGDR
jgi:hypothetical protein